CQQHSGYPWTF
nr:immunoglobulin light chain junction region [Macaca mulatta]